MRLIPLVFLASTLPVSAGAENALSPDQIVDFFLESALGTERGICIGTSDECAEPEPPTGLDLLIAFDHNSADLTAAARQNLVAFSAALQDDRLRAAKFVVEGHTDASGGERYNQKLAEARAKAVTDFLIGSGVGPDKIDAIGFGEAMPRTDDPYDPENRRVEMRLDLN